jgi:hypothetical protein
MFPGLFFARRRKFCNAGDTSFDRLRTHGLGFVAALSGWASEGS